jgi:hypothetical protein
VKFVAKLAPAGQHFPCHRDADQPDRTRMSVLLYFVSFASVAALFASIVAATIWIAIKFFQAWGRFFRTLLEPPDRKAIRTKGRIDLNSLKRAGQ